MISATTREDFLNFLLEKKMLCRFSIFQWSHDWQDQACRRSILVCIVKAREHTDCDFGTSCVGCLPESCCWEHVSSLVSRAELLHLVLSTATLELIRGFCDFYTIFHCIASLIVGVAARSSRHRRRGKGGYWSSLLPVLFGPSCVFLLQVQFALLRFICQSETRPLIIYPELKRMTIFWVQTCILKVVIVTSEDHFLLFVGF
jgi:hypothetical protein